VQGKLPISRINREMSEGRVPRAPNFPDFSIFRVFGAFRGHKSVNQNEDSSILPFGEFTAP
jgi:hypothetical protein